MRLKKSNQKNTKPKILIIKTKNRKFSDKQAKMMRFKMRKNSKSTSLKFLSN